MTLLYSMPKSEGSQECKINCSFCGTLLEGKKRQEGKTKNVYCNKTCMGKDQTERATITLECSYCKSKYQTLKGRHNERHQFCSQECSLKVRMDRYYWSICKVLAENDMWLSADMIRTKLREHKVDLTSMRIATRIARNKMIEVKEDSEPYVYRMNPDYINKPWTWHSPKFFRKLEMQRNEYVLMYEKGEKDATNSD